MWAKILTPLVEYQLSKHDVTRLCSGVNTQALSQNESYPLALHCAVLLCMKPDLRLWRQICIKRECIKAVKLWGHTCHSLPGSRNVSHYGYWQVAPPEVLLTQQLPYLILSSDWLYMWIWWHFGHGRTLSCKQFLSFVSLLTPLLPARLSLINLFAPHYLYVSCYSSYLTYCLCCDALSILAF